jgi:subfamily B ATP-binding cassette protein MsbA
MLKGAPILLLDEPTSALDAGQSNWCRPRSTASRRGARPLVIAHRLSTIRAADKIVVMEAGRKWSRKAPIRNCWTIGGAYARLHRLQSAHDGPGGI